MAQLAVTDVKRAPFKRALAALALSAAIITAAVPLAAWADPYTYTVRLYAGAQGSFSGASVYEITGLHYGDRVSFDAASVTVEGDGKYYVKGVREAGADTSAAVGAASFAVTEDADYVVAYGIAGDKVAYTVRYESADGRELLPPETLWGNVGDRPVVAYRYVDGYQPQAYNLTGELLADASQNNYVFVYRPQEGAPGEGPAASGASEAQDTSAGTAAAAPLAIAPAFEPATESIGDDTTPAAVGDAAGEPVEVVDIRDDGAPLAAGEGALADDEGATRVSAMPLAIVLVAVLGVVGICAVIGAHLRRRSAGIDGTTGACSDDVR